MMAVLSLQAITAVGRPAASVTTAPLSKQIRVYWSHALCVLSYEALSATFYTEIPHMTERKSCLGEEVYLRSNRP